MRHSIVSPREISIAFLTGLALRLARRLRLSGRWRRGSCPRNRLHRRAGNTRLNFLRLRLGTRACVRAARVTCMCADFLAGVGAGSGRGDAGSRRTLALTHARVGAGSGGGDAGSRGASLLADFLTMTLRRNRCDRLTRLRGDDTWTFELRSTHGRRYARVTMIVCQRKRGIFRCLLRVTCLIRRGAHVVLLCNGKLLRRGLHGRTAGAAVETHIGLVIDNDGLAVDVGDGDIRDVVDCSVVEESAVAPIAAFVADAVVAETINNAAIKADVWSPIAFVKNVLTIVPAPISGRPQ